MSPRAASLTLVLGILIVGTGIGLLAGRNRRMTLEQWTVAERHFGVVLLWLLMAGEIYTTFSFLGASGWAYAKGGPSLYILAYCTLAYVVSFFLGPAIWEYGRRHGLQTQPDFFRQRYAHPVLTPLVALVGVISLIPYIQLQLTGLGVIASVCSFDGIGRSAAMTLGAAAVAAFVFTGGLRAVAWVSILKDLLLLGCAVMIGLAVPAIHFGGIGRMFSAIIAAKPSHLTMPGSSGNLGHGWYVSSVILSSLGLYMWPQGFATFYSAKSAEVIRRNATVMPLYTLTLPFIFLAGFAAILVLPGLKNGDLALLTVARATFPPWVLGVIGGGGALTAMVPAALFSLTAATLFAKNLIRPLFCPSLSDDSTARIAKWLVVLVIGAALWRAIASTSSLVALLLLGYDGVSQLLPGVVLGFYWPRVTATAVLAGLLAGLACASTLILAGADPCHGLNAGFLALCLNFAVTIVLSLISR